MEESELKNILLNHIQSILVQIVRVTKGIYSRPNFGNQVSETGERHALALYRSDLIIVKSQPLLLVSGEYRIVCDILQRQHKTTRKRRTAMQNYDHNSR